MRYLTLQREKLLLAMSQRGGSDICHFTFDVVDVARLILALCGIAVASASRDAYAYAHYLETEASKKIK